jgi:hypothetical protein
VPRRNVVLTEFVIRVFASGRLDLDGFDRFLYELLRGGSAKELAIRSNQSKWRHVRLVKKS